MSARKLAEMIESYLEADDGSNGSSDSTVTVTDGETRQQLRQLRETTDQLKQNMSSLRNNLQMSTIMPLLMNPKFKVVADELPKGGTGTLTTDEQITFKPSDSISALLPMLLLGGSGDTGSGSDNSMNLMFLALALSGKL
jgi:hypothetical protein